MSQTIYLVSCVKEKLSRPAPARDLYRSALFLKARRYVENRGGPWFILSAKYGLVAPSEVIAPYDQTLLTMQTAERKAWARRVLEQLEPFVGPESEIVFLAGARYREYLETALEERGCTTQVPMQGLKIGFQLHWLDTHA